MKNFLNSMAIFFEVLKSFLFRCIIILVIIIAIICILHNVFRIREIYEEDTTGYKNLVWVDENRMNAQVTGSGEKTIVILSDYATPSPIIQYKTYVDKLSSSYRVVVIEYFGYGFSLSTKEERTSAQIASEIKTALEQVGIEGSYLILANGTSSIYAYTYTNMYPEDVEKLIVVDGLYPAMIENNSFKEYIDEQKTNSVITSYVGHTGFARILSYVKPDIFGIDKMQEYGFSKSDIALYRKMIANKFYTSTMKNEIKKLPENMENLKSYKFPDYLPVIQILSSEYAEENKEYGIEQYANNIMTNTDIQEVVVIEGNKNLNIYNPDAVVLEVVSE